MKDRDVDNGEGAAPIRRFVLEQVDDHPTDLSSAVVKHFGVSRQWATRQIARLVGEGALVAEGKTRNRRYRRASVTVEASYVTRGLEEHKVWEEFALPRLGDLPENVLHICSYGFSEMVNNVIDHSESPALRVSIERAASVVKLRIVDDGVGIFNKIQRDSGLGSGRDAIFDLTKGKFTTDPARHTGEGIFFTSRMFDSFAILSGVLYLRHKRDGRDWLLEDRSADKPMIGTAVLLEIDPKSNHTDKEVFDRYATVPDEYGFDRTIVAVGFASTEPLISRSQARRVVARLERFKEVVLDFRNVDFIGPAFADEVFRVFKRQHPEVSLVTLNASNEVEKMIAKVESDRSTTH